MLRLIILTAVFLAFTKAVPIDNGIEGEPEIECGPRSITVNFNTKNIFEGHVYVKGLFNQDQCRNDNHGRQVAGIELPFDTCNVRRSRSLNPKGVFIQTVIIVSFHPLFETKVDRAYRIQCFYMEADKTVDVTLQVSMLTTEFQTQNVPMPVCRYQILNGGPSGAPVSYAIIGQAVYHKWTCDTETVDTFCMIVHSCYVDDTNGDRVDLLSPNGCAVDRYLLNNLEYASDLMAGVEAHVFKYADRSNLYFQCQVTILVKEPHLSCPRPACPTPAGRGAGNANPTAGPVPAKPEQPFPLEPGSPYLPGPVQIGTNTGSPQNGPPPAPSRRPQGFVGNLPTFPGGGIRKRSTEYTEAGTLDVQTDMSALDVDENAEHLPANFGNRSGPTVSKQEDGFCLSVTTFAVVGTIGFASLILFIISVVVVIIRKNYKNAKL